MSFVQPLGQLRAPVSTYSGLPVSGNVIGDLRICTDTGNAYTWMISSPSGTLTNWNKVTTSSYADLIGAPYSTSLDIDNAVKVVSGLAINIALLAFNTLTGFGAALARMFDGVVNQFNLTNDGVDLVASSNYAKVDYGYFMPNKGDLDVNTKMLLHGDGIQGSTSFVDLMRHNLYNHGVTTDTIIKKFGTGSLKFDGASSLDLGRLVEVDGSLMYSETMALDFWLYASAGVQPIMSNLAYSDTYNPYTDGEVLNIHKDAANKISVSLLVITGYGQTKTTISVLSSSAVSSNAWNHIAIQKVNGYLQIWINGVLDATSVDAMIADQQNYFPVVLTLGKLASAYLTGYIDELRISDTTRYTTTFTPKTIAYNTSVTPAPTPTIVDISAGAKTVTPLGNARMSGTNPLFGNASLYLDGINSYLSLADSDDWDLSDVIDVISEEIVNQQQIVDGSGAGSVGYLTGGWLAQSFQITGTNPVSAVEVKCKAITGSPTGNWELRIETNVSGLPSGTLADAKASIVVTPPSAGNTVKGIFENYFYLTVGTTYWLVIKADDHSAGNFWDVPVNTSNPYANGVWAYRESGVWTTYSPGDMYFKVFTATPSISYSDYTIDMWIDPLQLTDLNTFIIGQDDSWKLTLDGTSNKYLKYQTGEGIDSNTKLMLHLDNNVIDEKGKTVTNNNVTFSSSVKKFGTHAASFNGTSSYLSTPNGTDFDFGVGDFTIDCWVNFIDHTTSGGIQIIAGQSIDGNHQWFVGILSGKLWIYFQTNSVVTGYYTCNFIPTDGIWYHLAFERINTGAKIFINGNSQVLTENVAFNSNNVGNVATNFEIGRYLSLYYFNGYIDELRISKGIARWTSNFTSPSSPYSLVSYVIAPIALTLEAWNHLAIVQKDGVIKLYVNGILGASVAGSAIINTLKTLTIGATSDGKNLFNGFIEEVRVSKGIARWTAAFTPPAVEYSSDSYTKLLLPLNVQTVPNMVLQSVGYVSNYVPTSARVVIFEEDIDVMEPNVDLVMEVSRDDGTTFTTVLLAKDQQFGDGTLNLYTGSVDLSSQPNGELLVWKLTTKNNKDCRIRGVSLNWR